MIFANELLLPIRRVRFSSRRAMHVGGQRGDQQALPADLAAPISFILFNDECTVTL